MSISMYEPVHSLFTSLLRVQGASNVRCSQCSHITPIAGMQPSQAAHTRAQLQCSGCQIMLMYPRGSNNVQCAVCGVVNSAQQVRLISYGLPCSSCERFLLTILLNAYPMNLFVTAQAWHPQALPAPV